MISHGIAKRKRLNNRLIRVVKMAKPVTNEDETPSCDCVFWGENRADELFLDVGCVLGYSYCDPKKCEDYYPVEGE